MHVYFSGIGGGGLAPGALIAQDAGYEVSGSDQFASQYTEYLKKRGISVHVGQTRDDIAIVHAQRPIDLFVYTLALPTDHPELVFCREKGIKTAKIFEFLKEFLAEKKLKVIAVAGTHGKTTTTAMAVWLFKQSKVPLSYTVGAKLSFGEMGAYEPNSEYFTVEADEFGGKFLAYHPFRAIISGLAHDHHELYPTQEDYNQAFRQFIGQSQVTTLWQSDAELLDLSSDSAGLEIEDESNQVIEKIRLKGLYNRRDAWLVIKTLAPLLGKTEQQLTELMNDFPGLSRRFEEIMPGLYSDYAHTPEKILGVMSVAKETVAPGQKIIVVYEPLTNRRMHYTADQHHDVFAGAGKIYWVPSYLAREDPKQRILSPEELIGNLDPDLRAVAEPANLDGDLADKIRRHLSDGDMVVALSGGGGGSLDEWLRQNFN